MKREMEVKGHKDEVDGYPVKQETSENEQQDHEGIDVGDERQQGFEAQSILIKKERVDSSQDALVNLSTIAAEHTGVRALDSKRHREDTSEATTGNVLLPPLPRWQRK